MMLRGKRKSRPRETRGRWVRLRPPPRRGRREGRGKGGAEAATVAASGPTPGLVEVTEAECGWLGFLHPGGNERGRRGRRRGGGDWKDKSPLPPPPRERAHAHAQCAPADVPAAGGESERLPSELQAPGAFPRVSSARSGAPGPATAALPQG